VRRPWAPLRAAAWTLVLIAAAAGRAQPLPCLPMAGGGELTVAGLGRVVFAALTTDRARDAASLTGGVCIVFDGIDGTLRTERLELTGLTGRVEVAAGVLTLELPGWALTAGELRSDGAEATLVGVTMRGAEAVAVAEEVVFDLVTGGVAARVLRLATETVWMDAATATFDGRSVWADDALLTTCDCPPEDAPAHLRSAAVRLDLEGPRLRLEGGSLHVAGVVVPLPEPFEVDAATVAAFGLPFSVGADPEGERGVVVSWAEREVAPGVRFAWDAGSGEGPRPPDVGLHLAVESEDAAAALTGGSQGLRATWRVRRPLAHGFSVGIGQRLETGAFRDGVRDQAVSVDWRARLERPAPGSAWLELALSAQAALSAQRLGGEEVVGSRFGVEARLLALGAEFEGGRAALEVTAGATGYPLQERAQAWIAVEPRWSVRSGPWVVEVGHLARWVAGESPFGVGLDRRLPLQRTELSMSVATPVGEGWRLEASTSVRLDWGADPLRAGRPVGVERLRVRLEAEGPAWGGRLTVASSGELAGWVDPRPRREAEATWGATWTRQRVELGARATATLDGAATRWREGVVFAAWPVVTGAVAWRPYLAVDLAALGRGGAGWWSGHGLTLAWTSCCGIVELGYRHDEGLGTRLHAALRFETHPLEPERLDASRGRVPTPVTTP
jgi:hypothetical protein